MLDRATLVVFVAELLLRVYGYGWRFFTDAWSVFDLLVVGIAQPAEDLVRFAHDFAQVVRRIERAGETASEKPDRAMKTTTAKWP